MRQFVFVARDKGYTSARKTEEQVLDIRRNSSAFPDHAYDLFELVPRTVKIVINQEIV